MIRQEEFSVDTKGRGTVDLTGEIQQIVSNVGIDTGLCHVFLKHTSASLMLCENADPAVRKDLETFMSRFVPDGDPMFTHTAETDVTNQYDLVVFFGKELLQMLTWFAVQTTEHFRVHAGHARGSFDQPLPVRIFTDGCQNLPDRSLDTWEVDTAIDSTASVAGLGGRPLFVP